MEIALRRQEVDHNQVLRRNAAIASLKQKLQRQLIGFNAQWFLSQAAGYFRSVSGPHLAQELDFGCVCFESIEGVCMRSSHVMYSITAALQSLHRAQYETHIPSFQTNFLPRMLPIKPHGLFFL